MLFVALYFIYFVLVKKIPKIHCAFVVAIFSLHLAPISQTILRQFSDL